MPQPDEPDATVSREVVFALLALVSVLIGISRLVATAPAPLWLKALDVAIAIAFAADWAGRVRRSPRPRRYALTHAYEALAFIPFTVLTFPETAGGNVLRGVRLIRVLRVLRYGRFVKVGLALSRLPRRARYLGRLVRNAQLANLLVAGIVVVALGAVALLVLEHDALGGGGYGAAFWWSLNLFTTANYAIPPPRTPLGFLLAGSLMVSGLAYLGVFTASLASAILRTPGAEAESEP